MIKRGDIHYILESVSVGSEQRAGRPAIIVSNNAGNATSFVVEVVFLTTKPKTDMPTHVSIRSATYPSTALCEQITSVSTERVGEHVGTCTKQEMEAIDRALCISLNLVPEAPVRQNAVQEYSKEAVDALTAERDMYKSMYDKLMDRILDRRI